MIVSFEWWIDALWRNGLALVPVALLAWLAVQLTARRPATRHVIWLGALSWLVIGLFLPPLQTASVDSESELHREELVTSEPREFFSDSSLVKIPAPVEQASPAWQDRESVIGSISLAAPSVKSWERDWQQSESLLAEPKLFRSITDSVERDNETHVRSEAALSNELTQNPTPPPTIARSSRQPSHVSSSVVGPVGQSSPTTQSPRTVLNHNCGTFDVASFGDEPPISKVDLSSAIVAQHAADAVKLSEQTDVVKHFGQPTHSPELASNDHSNDLASQNGDDSLGWLLAVQSGFGTAANTVQKWSRQLAALPRLPWQIWLTLSLGIVSWRVLSSVRFSLSLKRARPAPHAVQALVNECAELIGLRNAPTAHLVGQRVSPLIICYPRPRLIIPVELWSELDADSRRVVILHELAHLKRRDHWTHGLNTLLGALYWWHPLVWWMRRRIADEAENACDMWVTWLAPKSRRAYATALIQTQQFLSSKECTPTPASAVGILSPQAQRIARRLTMIMTHRNAPRSSAIGYLCVPALLLAAWVAAPAHSQTATAVAPNDDADEVYVVAETAPERPTAVIVGSGAGEVIYAPDVPDAPHVLVASGDGHDAHDHEHGHAHSGGGSGRAHARHHAPHADDERLARLEAQIAALAEQVERLSNQRARQLMPPPAPKAASMLPQQHMARVPKPTAPFVPGKIGQQQTMVRRYQIPAGKREALNNLMRRSDVPVLMRPRPDGIELIGTAAQQEVFERFVRMLGGKGMDHKKTYEIDSAQMEDLKALMIRDDVPVLVSPKKNRITVHGNELIQQTFKDFVEMIAPKGTKPITIQTTAPQALGSVYQNAPAIDALRAKEAAERARREAMVAQEYAAVRSGLRKAREQVKKRAYELEAKADQMQSRAEVLQAQYEELKAVRRQANSDRKIAELDRRLAEILAVKRDIEAQAEELYDAAAEAEAEIDEIEDEMDEVADG